MRVFIALEIPKDLKEKIFVFQKELGRFKGVKWVKPDNIHLTLKFLGEISLPQLSSVKEAIAEAVKDFNSFPVYISELGGFPHLRSPRVLWLGLLDQTENLFKIQNVLEAELDKYGFRPEKRRFTAHLTLGRITFPQKTPEIIGPLKILEELKKETITVKGISLMESKLAPAGSIYSLLNFFPFNSISH